MADGQRSGDERQLQLAHTSKETPGQLEFEKSDAPGRTRTKGSTLIGEKITAERQRLIAASPGKPPANLKDRTNVDTVGPLLKWNTKLQADLPRNFTIAWEKQGARQLSLARNW